MEMSPETSPRLGLSYVMPQQSQKHVTVNESFRVLDALTQIVAVSRTLTSPPSDPGDGAIYLAATGASGAWAGGAGQLWAYQDNVWIAYPPKNGWLVWIEDEETHFVWRAGAWRQAVRKALFEPTTYYVDAASGDDANTGKETAPFRMLGRALAFVATLDASIHDVTIQLNDGVHDVTEQQFLKAMGGSGKVIVQGNSANSEAVTVRAGGNASVLFYSINIPTIYRFKDIKIESTLPCFAFRTDGGASTVEVDNCVFGDLTPSGVAVHALHSSKIEIFNGVRFQNSMSRACQAVGGGIVRCNGQTLTFEGTPHFSNSFAWAFNGGLMFFHGISVSGAATGIPYRAELNAVILRASLLPGDGTPVVTSGAQIT